MQQQVTHDPNAPGVPLPDTSPPDPAVPPFEEGAEEEQEKYDGGPIPGTAEPAEPVDPVE
jgi:hypothetical protein